MPWRLSTHPTILAARLVMKTIPPRYLRSAHADIGLPLGALRSAPGMTANAVRRTPNNNTLSLLQIPACMRLREARALAGQVRRQPSVTGDVDA
jgi:hypothetical protein